MKIRKYCTILVLLLWMSLTAAAWFGPRKESSDAERRPLAQMPLETGRVTNVQG